jgi:plasmid stabilization system protein ParE
MSYRVRITESAEADFEKRLTALAERSPEAARKLHSQYLTALERLRDFPLSCGLAHEHAVFREPLRHLLFWVYPKRKFRALFTVQGDDVVVLAIRAPGEKDVSPGDIEY